jgi:hypothetical protein
MLLDPSFAMRQRASWHHVIIIRTTARIAAFHCTVLDFTTLFAAILFVYNTPGAILMPQFCMLSHENSVETGVVVALSWYIQTQMV